MSTFSITTAETQAIFHKDVTIVYPLALIAVCSVLVDLVYRSDLYQERIWVQLILWLISSLHANDTPSFWLAALFAASITSACFQRIYSIYPGEERIYDYTRLLAISMLPSVLYDLFNFQPSSQNEGYVYISLVCFALLSMVQWYNNSRKRRQFMNAYCPDESKWFSWNRSDVLYWIASLDLDWKERICPVIAPERIVGRCLQDLTVSDLQSIGIAYGDAQRLVECIQLRLISKYPNLCRTKEPSDEKETDFLQTWLGQEDEIPKTGFPHLEENTSFIFELKNEDKQVDEDFIQDRAKSVMKERFGFQLPDLKQPPAEVNECLPNSSKVENHDESKFNRQKSRTDALDAIIPNDVISSMPEHIREIVDRNPDLLQQIWNIKVSSKQYGDDRGNENEE